MNNYYLILSMNGAVGKYENFEGLFSFYPNGIKGLIVDYLFMYLTPVSVSCWETPDEICIAGAGTMEEEMLEKVIGLYESSWDYRSKQHSYPNCQAECTIEMVCADLAKIIWSTVKENSVFFNGAICFGNYDVSFSGECAVLKMQQQTLRQQY